MNVKVGDRFTYESEYESLGLFKVIKVYITSYDTICIKPLKSHPTRKCFVPGKIYVFYSDDKITPVMSLTPKANKAFGDIMRNM